MHGGLERGNQILEQMTKPNLLTTKDALVVKNKVAMQWFVNFLRKKDTINLFHLSPRWDIIKWIIIIGISQLFNGYVCTRQHFVKIWTFGIGTFVAFEPPKLASTHIHMFNTLLSTICAPTISPKQKLWQTILEIKVLSLIRRFDI